MSNQFAMPAASPQPDTLPTVDVFMLGGKNQMLRGTFNWVDPPNGTWDDIGGTFTLGPPAAVQMRGGTTHLFGIGIGNNLFHCALSPTWSSPPAWNPIGGES